MTASPAAVTARARLRRGSTLVGMLGVALAVLLFSTSSTLIKKASIPGPTMAFWRMIGSSVIWLVVMRAVHHRLPSRTELRRAVVPGIAFGVNITLFFSAVTHTTVANAEFIVSLTPVLLVPIGVWRFGERATPALIVLGTTTLAGLALVLFSAPANGEASWFGNAMAFVSMSFWCAYLVSSRLMRVGMDVVTVMASVMPIAAIAVLPLAAGTGDLLAVTWHSVPFILALVVLTGTAAHALVVFAQRSVPVATISIMQAAQPALAVSWSVLLLGATIVPLQVLGMAVVVVSLVTLTVLRSRG
ncbi:MAG: DMT family transporter [Ilumatobacteraceae bacterium]